MNFKEFLETDITIRYAGKETTVKGKDFKGEEMDDYLNANFIDDAEKMNDFEALTRDEFLESYSYLTDMEYYNTKDEYECHYRGYIIRPVMLQRCWEIAPESNPKRAIAKFSDEYCTINEIKLYIDIHIGY